MLRWLLKKFGYYHIDYGFTCGRHWMSINDVMIAQTSGDRVWLRDEDVHQLVYHTVDQGRHWSNPRAYTPFMCFEEKAQADPKYHAEKLMYLARLRRAEHPTDQLANWLDDAVHFLERDLPKLLAASKS